MESYNEPIFPISKIESFDEENLVFLQRDDRLPKAVKAHLSNYSKHRISGGRISTTYKLSDNCMEHGIGRLYPIDMLSMSGMRFDVRNPLAEKYYWDIDMENAHYRIALKYCMDYGIVCDNIRKYVDNRAEMLSLVSVSRKKAKTEFLKILYGGNIKLYVPSHEEVDGEMNPEANAILEPLKTEVSTLMEMIWVKHPHLLNIKCGDEKKQLRNQPPHKAKATLMSLVFQTCERKLLMFFDGFMR